MNKRQSDFSLPSRRGVLSGLTVLLIVFFSLAAGAEIYSWTDAQGVRHFSDSPPQDTADVGVTEEIPHDSAADKKHADAHLQMMEEIAARQQEEKERAEKEALQKRLEAAERQSAAAGRKAEEALKAAQDAQAAAEEKQRYREIYVVPEKRIGPYPRRKPAPLPGGSSSGYPQQLN